MFIFQTNGGGDWISWLLFFLLFLFMTEIQVYMLIYNLSSFLDEVRVYDRLGRWYIVSLIMESRRDLIEKAQGKNAFEKAKSLRRNEEFLRIISWTEEILESFMISPVSLDPSGILKRLEHLLDVRRKRLRGISEKIIPNAPTRVKRDLESALEAAATIHNIYKITEHIFRVGVNTKSYIYLMQLQTLVPFLREMMMSYYDALKAFRTGIPIGDSIGPMVAQSFFGKEVEVDSKNSIAYSVSDFEGRYVLALKALGPGSEVGKPGEVIRKIVEDLKGDLNAVITVDAALRLESEKTGDIAVGIGAAIGDPGPEKWKIEEVCTKYKIPLFAVVIKESYVEAVTPMDESIANAYKRAVETIKRIIREEIPPEGKVLIAGIGNTVGVGNEAKEKQVVLIA
ncbi:MAG: DUF1512 domain-containing protein [Candidatus Njordarchaeum guaymaensis]